MMFLYALYLGVILAGLWVLVYAVSWVYVWTWAWIDDTKCPKHNPLIVYIMLHILLFEDEGANTTLRYRKRTDNSAISEGAVGFFLPLLLLFAAPMVVVISFMLIEFVLILATAIGLAFLARFFRRLHKKFTSHEHDKSIHGNVNANNG